MELPSDSLIGVGISYGSFGELLQGALEEKEQDFLVTLPITRRSKVQISLRPDIDELSIQPEHKYKSLYVARATLSAYGLKCGGHIEITSELPEGKGMSSSSADLVATVRAVGDALGIHIAPPRIEGLLRGVEPTDGIMYNQIVAFFHRRVRLLRVLSPLPALTIVGIDEGGQLDTLEYNASRPPISKSEQQEYTRLLELLDIGLASKNLKAVGSISTRSAELNQQRCAKKYLDDMLRISCDVEALGVTVAHSGTVIGVLLSNDDPCYPTKVAEVKARCAQLNGEVFVDYTVRTPLGVARR